MRIFKTQEFSRFAKKEGISDYDLCEAVSRAVRGLVDANLGGGIIKQRIARPGQGRSGGFRTIIVLRYADRAIFVYGFAKNRQANINIAELRSLKEFAGLLLSFSNSKLSALVTDGDLIEVHCNEKVP